MSSPPATSFVLNLRALPTVASDTDPDQLSRFCRGPELDGLRRAVTTELRKASHARGALMFVSGGAKVARVVAESLVELLSGMPTLFVPSTGVFCDAVEVENQPATSGLIWSRTAPELFVCDSSQALRDQLSGRSGAVVSFWPAVHLEGEPELKSHAPFEFGAGYSENQLLATGIGDRAVTTGAYAALRFRGEAPLIERASACRTVAGPFEITAADGRVVLALDGKPALSVFSQHAGGGRHAGLMLIGLHSPHDPNTVVARALRGIDPTRKALVLPGPALIRQQLSFLVRDAQVARSGIEQAAERAKTQVHGSSPRFGLYFCGSGRGRALYGEVGGEPRALRKPFPRMPLVGMHSSYEVNCEGERAELDTVSGSFAVFRALS